ncbi:MAG: hypothetical protein O3B01_10705 [Planctomycetota bacterium]|nr:hypothetical protein [Planctomycetota bacterium]MDA1139041.1 hypothetical protein [Planctomycetota bacterium]
MKKRPLRSLNIPPETVDLRLREMSALHKLGMSMKGAKWIGKVREIEKAKERSEESHEVIENELAGNQHETEEER